jgi:hypothetical protein
MFIRLVSCFILLIKFPFHAKVMKLEKRLTKVENELKSMKEEARKKEAAANEEAAKRTTENKRTWWPYVWMTKFGKSGKIRVSGFDSFRIESWKKTK